jgi:cyclophilin family peptidyl-prolyl cis-trans isomerase
MRKAGFTALTILCAIAASGFVRQASAQANQQAKGELLTGDHHAIIETSLGKIEIELYTADAPKTVTNFVKLAEKKYFDGQRVHRVVPNFVIQTGDDKSKDPTKKNEWGTGGKSIWGKEFEDELNPSTPSYKEGYKRGVVAMANKSVPGTNSSQFFIMLADNTSLPKAYTIFGKVVKGMEVVDKIAKSPLVQGTSIPQKDVKLKRVRILHSGGAAPAN